MRDHPRVCGEKAASGGVDVDNAGSPPRVRGKGLCDQRQHVVQGITPACAGKRGTCQGQYIASQDHPRVCGEKPFSAPGTLFPSGSPPRVRGKAVQLFQLIGGVGITPACAGKSQQPKQMDWEQEDHPRVCGEKEDFLKSSFGKMGSPPRVRGKDGAVLPRHDGAGITPACAGKRS